MCIAKRGRLDALLSLVLIITTLFEASSFRRGALRALQPHFREKLPLIEPLCATTGPLDAVEAIEGAADVCIIGGGFGGLYTAIKLHELTNGAKRIVLIDPKSKFVFQPLLYELATERASVLEVAPQYADLLRDTSVKFIQGMVETVDLDGRCLHIQGRGGGAERSKVPFSLLVVSCGAQPRLNLIPGAEQHSMPFYRVEDAFRLKAELRSLQASDKHLIRVAVIGGGYSGVEVATSVAEYIGKSRAVVSIIDRNEAIMHTSPKHNREAAEKALVNCGVSINVRTSVLEVCGDGVLLQSKLHPDEKPYFAPADNVK